MSRRLAVVLGLMLAPLLSQGATPPESRPQGRYQFNGDYGISKLRIAIQLRESDPDFASRLKELRQQGFTCIHNALKKRLCTKVEKPSQWPEDVDSAIRRGLAGTEIEFPGPHSEPELVHDGSQTEWLYREPALVRGVRSTIFKLIQKPEKLPIIQFPVNEEQPIPYVDYLSDNSLQLHMILSGSDGDFTIGYFIEAKLAHL